MFLLMIHMLLFNNLVLDLEAKTEDGKTVILKDNGTWSYKGDATEGLDLKVLNKKLRKQTYEDLILFDLQFTSRFSKPTRAIKGVIVFMDLFGDEQLSVAMTITDPLKPGEMLNKKGLGIEYNQFRNEHNWLIGIELKDVTYRFDVYNVIMADGTRIDYE